MTEPESPSHTEPTRLEGIPVQQLLSFLTHDIYGPTSMLRTYLRALADSAESPELRQQLTDAENLSGQIESMVRLTRALLGLASGQLELQVRPVKLASFLFQFVLANTALHRQDRVSLDEDVRVVTDERQLAMVLEVVAWQMGRMGERQGPMAVGVLSTEGGWAEVGLWRVDAPLEGALLERALDERDEDWSSFLRRLPACGFPLRIAKRLVVAAGCDANSAVWCSGSPHECQTPSRGTRAARRRRPMASLPRQPDGRRTARILLVDDHPVVRNGLRLMLRDYPEFDVVAEAESCEDALQKVASLRPELVLMDINLGNTEKDGIYTTRQIVAHHPGTQVIIISMGKEKSDIRNAIEAGAVGYLVKDITGPDLARALTTVLEGGSAMSPEVSREVLREFTGMLARSTAPPEHRESLSEKEREVLVLLCKGKSNRDIGGDLYITEKTVKSHITAILRKLGVKDRTQAVIRAIQQKMVDI